MCSFHWNLPVYSKITLPSCHNSSLNSVDCLGRVCSPRMCICQINPTSCVARLGAVYSLGKWKAVHTRVLSLASTGIVPAAKQKSCEFSVPPCQWKKHYEYYWDIASEELLQLLGSQEAICYLIV